MIAVYGKFLEIGWKRLRPQQIASEVQRFHPSNQLGETVVGIVDISAIIVRRKGLVALKM
mgnify:CR=1 FL=1